jgi:hypothetical protein
MKLPELSSLQCIHALLKLGYTIRRQHALTVALERPGRIVVVPLGKVLTGDALMLILLAARVTPEELAQVVAGQGSGEHGLDGEEVARAPSRNHSKSR